YYDEDGIDGRRRIKVEVTDDAAPRVENLEPDVVLRTPKDKANNKLLVRRKGGKTTTNTLVATRHAILPFKGKISDDICLTEVQWDYTVEEVHVRFSGPPKGTDGKAPEAEVELSPAVPFARAVSVLQYTPGTPMWMAPRHLDFVSKAVPLD